MAVDVVAAAGANAHRGGVGVNVRDRRRYPAQLADLQLVRDLMEFQRAVGLPVTGRLLGSPNTANVIAEHIRTCSAWGRTWDARLWLGIVQPGVAVPGLHCPVFTAQRQAPAPVRTAAQLQQRRAFDPTVSRQGFEQPSFRPAAAPPSSGGVVIDASAQPGGVVWVAPKKKKQPFDPRLTSGPTVVPVFDGGGLTPGGGGGAPEEDYDELLVPVEKSQSWWWLLLVAGGLGWWYWSEKKKGKKKGKKKA